MPCKHKALKSAAPKSQFYCGCSNAKAYSEGRGSEKRPYRIAWVTLGLAPYIKCCVVTVVSDNSQFSWGCMPLDSPKTLCAQTTACCARRTNPQLYILPFFPCWWRAYTIEDRLLRMLPPIRSKSLIKPFERYRFIWCLFLLRWNAL